MRTFRIVLILFVVALQPVLAQDTPNFQNRYANAKSLFANGQYELAMVAFREVAQPTSGNPYVAYANYYYGLSAWAAQQKDVAEGIWSQTGSNYPAWHQQAEIQFWLGASAFAQGNLQEGYRRLEQMKQGPQKDALETVKSYYLLKEKDVQNLQLLFEQNSDDEELALHLADCIASQPMVQQNQELLDFIIRDFELDPSRYNRITKEQSVHKEVYRVAVMLPFQESILKRRINNIPELYHKLLGMYEGMRMATERLNAEGMQIELLAYDTRNDSATTAKLLAEPEMKTIDLIIGPLLPKQVDMVREFSEQNRILMFNPWSTNSDAIGNNPFSFLISPSNETRARQVARYAAAHDPDSVAYIFYGTRAQDSIYAYAYQGELLARGFEVPVVLRIEEDNSQAGFQFLTKTVRYNTLQKMDSLRAVEAYADFLSRKRDNENLRLEKEEFFEIPNDSIGHVLVAADNGLIAASMVGAIETRAAKGDSIGLIGSEEWMLQGYSYVTYEQLERLGVLLTAPTYFSKSTLAAEAFQEEYIRRQNILPLREVYVGYDMLMFLGTMLHQHGTYFQFGMQEEGLTQGVFLPGYDFRGANDNQFVPLLRFRDYRFEIIDHQITTDN